MSSESKYSFNLDSKGMLEKLKMEYSDFESDPSSSRHAVNFAITAHHMIDWVWHERIKNKKEYILNDAQHANDVQHADDAFKKFIKKILDSKSELKYCQDISNGTKHYTITRYTPKLKETKTEDDLMWEKLNVTWDKAHIRYGYSGLTVLTSTGELKELPECFKLVIDFWEDFLSKNPL
ncbi:MAG: hypothetical protein BGO43_03295 [Gammaproteobacteria bacterium 39-13]|nr:hypothetical protein [Gammaproteobacteria bacterium]OJV92038.1 MAG: hypothetical protein BGO43_03295 [Gammaproteobacteria bacterium 39-13]